MRTPEEEALHVMTAYRHYLLGCKKKWGVARSLVHYKKLLQIYLECKRVVIKARREGTLAA